MKKNLRRRRCVRHSNRKQKALFRLGCLFSNRRALDLLDGLGVDSVELLDRHRRGDWGEVPAEDAKANKFAVLHRLRIVSCYRLGAKKVFVVTEAGHTATTILRYDEY